MHVQEAKPGHNCEDGVGGCDAYGVDEREDAGGRERDGKLAHGTEQGRDMSKVH